MPRAAALIVILTAGLSAPAHASFKEAEAEFSAAHYARAIDLYKEAAEKGDVNAQRMLARIFFEGLGVHWNSDETKRWAEKAGAQGDPWSLHLAGYIQDLGFGIAKDREAAEAFYKKALDAAAARPKDPWSELTLWICNEQGHGVKSDRTEALKHLRKAAEAGLGQAQEILGGYALRGQGGVEKDYLEAVKWLTKAAGQGLPIARLDLAEAQLYGEGVPADVPQGLATVRALAEAGLAEAQGRLGGKYYYGAKVPRDYKLAREWWLKAGEQGESGSLNGLAWMYRDGVGVEKDYASAMRYFRLAADHGSNNGRAGIGMMYLKGLGVAKDYDEAYKWLKKSSDYDNPEAKVFLAEMYQTGEGVAVDDAKALELLRRSAALGDKRGMTALGRAYELGLGIEKDRAAAAAWYRKAVELKDPDGAVFLGRLYKNGWGVAQDYAKALELYRKAGPIPRAQFELAWLYQNGLGVKKDLAQAAGLLAKAADQGDAPAQARLGSFYEKGSGVAQDFVQAYYLYLKASAQGDEDAAKAMEELGKKLTADQIAQAQKRAASSGAAPANNETAKTFVSDVDSPSFKLPERPEDFALVVGIEKYEKIPEARFAERDAEAVKKSLLAMGVPERNIVSLSGRDATRSRLQAYLEEWLPKNVKPGSTVFFYFSGHGAPDAETKQAFLVPSDGDPMFLKTTAYAVKDVYGALNKLKAKTVVAALDSCFSGAGGRSVIPSGARPLVSKIDSQDGAGRIVLFTAAAGDQITGGDEQQGHGMFTYYFLKGLEGGAADDWGQVTTGGLEDYLRPLVEDEAHRQNREQTPALAGAKDVTLVKLR